MDRIYVAYDRGQWWTFVQAHKFYTGHFAFFFLTHLRAVSHFVLLFRRTFGQQADWLC